MSLYIIKSVHISFVSLLSLPEDKALYTRERVVDRTTTASIHQFRKKGIEDLPSAGKESWNSKEPLAQLYKSSTTI